MNWFIIYWLIDWLFGLSYIEESVYSNGKITSSPQNPAQYLDFLCSLVSNILLVRLSFFLMTIALYVIRMKVSYYPVVIYKLAYDW
jgi:hypothetical protein